MMFGTVSALCFWHIFSALIRFSCANGVSWRLLGKNACLCRGTMAEGMDMKEKTVFEDAGIDTDEQVKVSLRDFNNLVSKRARR